MYTVDYFIKKFEAIPENKWNDHTQYNPDTDTCCAFGHLQTIKGRQDGWKTPEGLGLADIFNSVGYCVNSNNWITDVNNGRSKKYQQRTPKTRILAALYDIKAMQEKEKKPKERIVYVSVPETIKEQTEELILS